MIESRVLREKARYGPVATLSRVMIAMKGRRALITSRETFRRREGEKGE